MELSKFHVLKKIICRHQYRAHLTAIISAIMQFRIGGSAPLNEEILLASSQNKRSTILRKDRH